MLQRNNSTHAQTDARRLWLAARFRSVRRPAPERQPAIARPHTFARAFGNLRVRPKLMVLHNIFFLVLTCAAYFSLIPLFERQVYDARTREVELIRRILANGVPESALRALGSYDYREGRAAELAIPPAIQSWIDARPGEVWFDVRHSAYVYQRLAGSPRYRQVRFAPATYTDVVDRARLALFVVLGAIYVLAVILLETAIMPWYVYRPLRLMLDADQATHRGDREHELIPNEFILGDEVGQIMRSRNATVAELREHEDNLAAAIRQLEEQDRLASLGLLSASVAHELNTPLAVLHGSIEKLKETTKDPHTLERLSRMERVTQRLRRISESLVEFARQRKQQMELLDLRPLVDESWQLVAIDERAAQVSFRNEVKDGDDGYGKSGSLDPGFREPPEELSLCGKIDGRTGVRRNRGSLASDYGERPAVD